MKGRIYRLSTEIGEYQNTVLDEEKKPKQVEIDLLGKNDKNIRLVGECKFQNSAFDKAELEKLMDKIKYLPAIDPVICIFSLHGFTDYVKNNAKNCKLISIDDMYE